MKTIQYFEILKRALIVTWNNSFLWFFGVIIVLGSIISNIYLNGSSINNQIKYFDAISNVIKSFPNLINFLGSVFFILSLVFFLFRLIAIASLIKSLNDIKLYRQLGFNKIISESKIFLWKLLKLEILVCVALAGILIILAVPVAYLFTLNSSALAAFLLMVALIIFIPLVLMVSYMRKYAYYFIILSDNKDIVKALESAYLILSENLGPSVYMGVLTIGLSAAMYVGIIILLAIFAFISAPIGLLMYWIFAKTGAMIVLTLAIIISAVAVVGILSLFEVFLQSIWLFFFQQIAFKKLNKDLAEEKITVEGEIPTPEAV